MPAIRKAPPRVASVAPRATVTFSVRLETLAKIDDAAHKAGLSRSRFIARAAAIAAGVAPEAA